MEFEQSTELPWPDSPWCRYMVELIGTTLRDPDENTGLTPDMVLPIFPNTDHARQHDPVRPMQAFPFPNCYHWLGADVTVRILPVHEGHSRTCGVYLSSQEHVMIQRKFQSDVNRIYRYQQEKRRAMRVMEVEKLAEIPPHPISDPVAEVTGPQPRSDVADIDLGGTQVGHWLRGCFC